ncbi:hypothetical protein RGR602_CH03138 [Rhizobium gallicum bv. gallicum R602sp]|uniref:Uncharacterized protein n=1 Tax=Rhizobium gallicum bv. gallicum R602sp TaxID=1041138 RepID=A0A0B4X6Y7_9HYPH|nr:hypothetical protein [Rhizobium gallicum]AJD42455.1 hypothetical protein RGR602_CH03138 [Rhizobium gallicum bv. gallicum R602sp]TDW20760.1 hypothetical protein EV128_124109 [Rhizobium azibense]
MKNLLIRTFVALLNASPSYLISGSHARADDWGCQVILCLSNPGGATQFTECRPPIEKLWRELAKGHAFPSCNGNGFTASAPGYAPYYCDKGYRLTTRYSDRGRQVSCISTTPQTVSNNECYSDSERGVHSSAWHWNDGQRQCQRYVTMQPHMRAKPHYVDVTIDGIGNQRVWY